MSRKPKKSKPPSRVRYEAAHPTVSVRVSQELYDQLDGIRISEGKSFGDILREAVRVQSRTATQAHNRGFTEGRRYGEEQGYERGRAKGQAAAKSTYLVKYRCGVCGKWMELDSEPEREAARQCLEERRWCHRNCLR